MLKKLRREFVVITMALVGLVLVVALGTTLVSGYVNQANMINGALTRGLEELHAALWGAGRRQGVPRAELAHPLGRRLERRDDNRQELILH